MKKIIIFCLGLLLLGGCTPSEVRTTDKNIHLKDGSVYYRNKPYTGTLIQDVPFTGRTLEIGVVDGKVDDVFGDLIKSLGTEEK